jgi:hypothetical protein
MIYLRIGKQHVVILEPENLERVKTKPCITPNASVMICYTPDALWLGDQIVVSMDEMTPDKLDSLIKESQDRPEVRNRPYHPPLDVKDRGEA